MSTGMNEDYLQELAYRIWEMEGRPFGQAERHWQMALEQASMGVEQSTTGTSTSGDDFLGDEIIPESPPTLLQNELQSSQATEKIGGKRKTRTKAKSADSLAEQDTAISGRSKPKKRKAKSSDNILI